MRTLLTVCLIGIGIVSFAQNNAYQISIEGIASLEQSDQITSLLQEVKNPHAFYFIEEEGIFHINSKQPLTQNVIAAKLEKKGYVLQSFVALKTVEANLMRDYPQYVNTGNNEADKARYEQAKHDWVAQYPDRYRKLKGIRTKHTPKNYPVYVNTGNKKADAKRYEAAKKEWVKNNPTAYRKMDDKPEREKVTQADYNNASQDKQQYIDAHPDEFEIVD